MMTDNEKKEYKWWARHIRGNVAYLAARIKELVDNPDDEEYRKFFYNHFGATIDILLLLRTPSVESPHKGMGG